MLAIKKMNDSFVISVFSAKMPKISGSIPVDENNKAFLRLAETIYSL